MIEPLSPRRIARARTSKSRGDRALNDVLDRRLMRPWCAVLRDECVAAHSQDLENDEKEHEIGGRGERGRGSGDA